MRRVNWESRNVIALFPAAVKARQPAVVTVFEGARLIVGDGGAPIADAAFIHC